MSSKHRPDIEGTRQRVESARGRQSLESGREFYGKILDCIDYITHLESELKDLEIDASLEINHSQEVLKAADRLRTAGDAVRELGSNRNLNELHSALIAYDKARGKE